MTKEEMIKILATAKKAKYQRTWAIAANKIIAILSKCVVLTKEEAENYVDLPLDQYGFNTIDRQLLAMKGAKE